MQEYPDPKDPTESDVFPFNWAPKLGEGETITSAVASAVDTAGTTIGSASHDDTVTRVPISGGTDGARATWLVRIGTSAGRWLEEAFAVQIVDKVTGAPAETDSQRNTRLLREAEDALHALNLGQRVVEVVRDGRRIRYQESNKGDLVSYIDTLKRELETAAIATAGARPRRRFIPVDFG